MRSLACPSSNLGFTSLPAIATLPRLVSTPLLPFSDIHVVHSWKGHHVPVNSDEKSHGKEGVTHKKTGIALDPTLLPGTRLPLSTKSSSTGLLGLRRLNLYQTNFFSTVTHIRSICQGSTISFKSIPKTNFQRTNNGE